MKKLCFAAIIAAAVWSLGCYGEEKVIAVGDYDKTETLENEAALDEETASETEEETAETEEQTTDEVEAEEQTVENEEESADMEPAGPWDGIKIVKVNAPDDLTVAIEFSSPPPLPDAANFSIYTIESEKTGSVRINSVVHQPGEKRLYLATMKQKLGVEYSVNIMTGPLETDVISAKFLSADTKKFWVSDFADPNYGQKQITAVRGTIGKNCVVYVQEGYKFIGEEIMAADFDDKIYPKLTGALIEAPDFDENGKILLLGENGEDYYGGYFSPINQYSDFTTWNWWKLHSNEMEMITMNVLVEGSYLATVAAHEFGHLLYHKRHGLQQDYWEYHDEGLAECAVHNAYGANEYGVAYFQYDPNGTIGGGRSMVHWRYAEYENYVLAYLFWTYLAGRLTGDATGYEPIFDLDDGSPETVNEFIKDRLGIDFPTAHFNSHIAMWKQDESGDYSFNGMLEADKKTNPVVPAGTTSVDLEPFGAAFFKLDAQTVAAPPTKGEHVIYAGINGGFSVSTTEPYDAENGALLAYHANMDYAGWETEHSGPDLAAAADYPPPPLVWPACGLKKLGRHINPPPYNPLRPDIWQKWRQASLKRTGR